MKTYGKEPESLESITRIFKKDLAQYPAHKILRAISTYASREDEFPTVSDIAGLIKRNGRPPIKESDIISIRKKEGCDRTPDEWHMLRAWEAEKSEGWIVDPNKEILLQHENERLRAALKAKEIEYDRLAELLREERCNKGLERPVPSIQEKIDNTVAELKASGVPQETIDEFLLTQKL